ncbi:hypothetical protein J5X98_07825 [Leptothermofonsia sichuanensis E412]|jgi:hypothetical protein|uniref:hypothetical protein n=1 Tax=Leptothermofonsia sichuanensis TaxID=2917832 RepID=UPI001CA73A15|nr:hypothetical protein [Leptothermofonsia sichuanensis]QZZ22286.1 hypothetical protein J5X98_07825 [Leptothermofonsia sichuanensis E412]
MKLISTVLKPFRFLFLIFTCALLIFSLTSPALAGSDRSTMQEDQAAKVYTKKAEDTLRDAPQSLKEVQKRTGENGLNEVQGTAGAEAMKSPSNSNASSPLDYIERALDKAQNKADR